MSGTISQVSHNVESLAPPPLGPELASGKWRVRVIDGDGNITEERISGKEVWSMLNRRVMVDFNRRGQPIKDSGEMKTRMKGLEDIVTNALFALVKSENQFQVSAISGNRKFNTNLHQSSSMNSDQESGISRTVI